MTAENEAKVSSKPNLKNAASLLLKGGVLIQDQCAKCGGVQVRFKDRITCINCGNEQLNIDPPRSNVPEKEPAEAKPDPKPDLKSSSRIIEEKIALLANDLQSEQDLGIQKQKADLLETYVRILEKMANLSH